MDKTPPVAFNWDLIKPKTRRLLRLISRFLHESDTRGYLVGGFVRDVLLQRSIADIDIAVQGNALELGKKLAAELGGTFVPLDVKNKVARIVLKDAAGTELDLTSFRGKIETDLRRRDFTFNAMALDLPEVVSASADARLIDPFNGMKDLSNGVVRAVADKAFIDDPVRVLRAVRFYAELGFTIDFHTEELIKQSAGLLPESAGERIREEFMRLLDVSHDGQACIYLDELGILTVLFPELNAARGVSQPVEHHWDVFTHSLQCVKAVDFILRQGTWDYPDKWILKAVPWPSFCPKYFASQIGSGTSRRTLLKLAALLHDVAKPQTKAPDKNGRMRFIGHPEQGAEIVKKIMGRLNFSSKEKNFVTSVVQYHLRPTQMGLPPTSRAIYRYFRDTGDSGIAVLYISLADHLATRGPGLIPGGWREHANMVRYVLRQHFRRVETGPPPKLLDGHDLIDVFGLQPGPELGELLETVREAQGAGELTNRHQALDYIRNVLSGRKK